VSPRTVPGRDHLSWSGTIEGKNPAGALRQIGLVGKQTNISNRTTSAAPLFLAEWSPRFVLFHRVSSAPRPARQRVYLVLWGYSNRARPAWLRLLRSINNTKASGFAHKLFSLHELPSGFQTRGLTRGCPRRYTAIARGRSRHGGLIESPNGPVGGLSPEIVESAV